MKNFWLRNEKIFICLTYVMCVMVFSAWAAQQAVTALNTRNQAWTIETANNADLQTNIDGKETADAAIVKSDEAETLSAAWDLGTPSAGVGTNLTGIPLATGVTGILPLANGGTGANLADPGADRVGFWDDSATSFAWLTMGTNLSITDTTLNATGSGGTTVDAIGDAAGAGAVDFVTYLQQWDVGTAGFQIGDGGSNYAQFSTTGITFGGTYTLSANLVSDYITFTPSATPPATTDGRLRNTTGYTGLSSDTFSFWDGSAIQYILNYDTLPVDDGARLTYNAANDDFDWGVPAAASAYASGTESDYMGTIKAPDAVYTSDPNITIELSVPAAFTITELIVQCDADPTTEQTITFYHKAAGVGYGTPTTIEAVTTVNGTITITSGIDDPTIPADVKLFMTLSDPDNALTEISWRITGDFD